MEKQIEVLVPNTTIIIILQFFIMHDNKILKIELVHSTA